MPERFFVKVYAADRRRLAQLQRFDYDLFQPTARVDRDGAAVIDGLLTLAQIENLVKAGYRVLVEAEGSARARGQEVVEFSQWLEERKKAR